MEVSKIWLPPNHLMLIGISIINPPVWGTAPFLARKSPYHWGGIQKTSMLCSCERRLGMPTKIPHFFCNKIHGITRYQLVILLLLFPLLIGQSRFQGLNFKPNTARSPAPLRDLLWHGLEIWRPRLSILRAAFHATAGKGPFAACPRWHSVPLRWPKVHGCSEDFDGSFIDRHRRVNQSPGWRRFFAAAWGESFAGARWRWHSVWLSGWGGLVQ